MNISKLVIKKLPVFVAICCQVLPLMGAARVEASADWSGTGSWIGPHYWANPITHWQLEDGEVVALSAANHTLHHLVHQVVAEAGDLNLEVMARFESSRGTDPIHVGGFRLGIRGWLDDYRHALISANKWHDAGIRSDGHLVFGNVVSDERMNPEEWVHLRLGIRLGKGNADVKLTAENVSSGKSIEINCRVPAREILGNLALLANGAGRANRSTESRWRFKDWRLEGSVLSNEPEQAFGPILWSQYTLSRNILKMLVMMAPVEDSSERVHLEIKRNGHWVSEQASEVDPLSRTAVFRVKDWEETRRIPYRITYTWKGKPYAWEGTIRPEPGSGEAITLAAFSCDKGYIFPNARIVGNVAIQDPDLLFFAGDQIYESFGGFGLNRTPIELAMLDYLRKYWQFGWSWRHLLKDRPSIIIPDDHDVFQGNLWGHGGRRIPDLVGRPSGKDWPKGGYAMDPQWINAVERTQTASLPDPVDPEPAGQGIGVYFTQMEYGSLDIAVVEDRKFKTGPKDPDKEEPQLLGPRQEAFLADWMASPNNKFKVVLSQTIFCDVATHTGGKLSANAASGSSDSNGWPKSKRDKALSILKDKGVVMVHGDQHLGALVHHGVDAWEDSAVAFMVPGSANGFPRAWWPDQPGKNHVEGEPSWTGRYLDSLGNRMTVLAAANPEKGSNLLTEENVNPETIAHKKGSGHGLIRFDPETGMVTFEMWRLQFDAARPLSSDQFEGFPKVLNLGNW